MSQTISDVPTGSTGGHSNVQQAPALPATSGNPKVARPYSKAKIPNGELSFNEFLKILADDEDMAHRIFVSNESLKETIAGMRTLFSDLQAACDKLTANATSPAVHANCLPDPPNYQPSPPMPALLADQERLFWFQGQWKKAQSEAQKTKKATRSAVSDEREDYEQDCRLHEKFGWMVDEDGIWHRVSTLSEVTAVVRAALITLDNWGKLGQSFTLHTGIEAKVWIVTLLERMFPWLALCAAHWKALYLVQEVAHGYLQTLRKNKSKAELSPPSLVKTEDTVVTIPSPPLSGITTPSTATSPPPITEASLKRKLEDTGLAAEEPAVTTPTPFKKPVRLAVLRKAQAAQNTTVTFAEPLMDIAGASNTTSQWNPPLGPIPQGAPPPWDSPNDSNPSGTWLGDTPAAPYAEEDEDEDNDSNIYVTDDEGGDFGSGQAPLQVFGPSSSTPMAWNQPPMVASIAPTMPWNQPPPPTLGSLQAPMTNWGAAAAPKKKMGRPKAAGKMLAYADWKVKSNTMGDEATLQVMFEKIWKGVPPVKKQEWNNFAAVQKGGAPAIAVQNSAAIQFHPPGGAVGLPQPKLKKAKRQQL